MMLRCNYAKWPTNIIPPIILTKLILLISVLRLFNFIFYLFTVIFLAYNYLTFFIRYSHLPNPHKSPTKVEMGGSFLN